MLRSDSQPCFIKKPTLGSCQQSLERYFFICDKHNQEKLVSDVLDFGYTLSLLLLLLVSITVYKTMMSNIAPSAVILIRKYYLGLPLALLSSSGLSQIVLFCLKYSKSDKRTQISSRTIRVVDVSVTDKHIEIFNWFL